MLVPHGIKHLQWGNGVAACRLSGALMNPDHAVDIYIDAVTLDATVFRRRDSHWWHSGGAIDDALLGLAIKEAIDPKTSHRLAWDKHCDSYMQLVETRQIVVVWRQDHGILIGTPLCPWGKAPNVSLGEWPQNEELGNAVLDQARYSASAAARHAELK